MKAGNYREMSDEELGIKLQDLEKQLYEIRSQAVTEKLANCKAVINMRKEIARIKTVIREKQLTK